MRWVRSWSDLVGLPEDTAQGLVAELTSLGVIRRRPPAAGAGWKVLRIDMANKLFVSQFGVGVQRLQ